MLGISSNFNVPSLSLDQVLFIFFAVENSTFESYTLGFLAKFLEFHAVMIRVS